jgi:hypothetical protein
MLGFAVSHEIAHPPHDLAGADRLAGCLVERLASSLDIFGAWFAFKEVPGPLALACQRR